MKDTLKAKFKLIVLEIKGKLFLGINLKMAILTIQTVLIILLPQKIYIQIIQIDLNIKK